MKNLYTFFVILLLVNTRIMSQWSSDPSVNTLLASTGAYHFDLQIVSDGDGGGILGWYDDFSNLYLQRVTSEGITLWPSTGSTAGIFVDNIGTYATSFRLASDGSGGVIVLWDYSSAEGSNKLYAQRFNAAGEPQWTVSSGGHGVEVSTDPDPQKYPVLLNNGAGGAVFAWIQENVTTDIYAQQINSSGAIQWGATGVIVAADQEAESFPVIVTDGGTGTVIVWESGSSGIRAQRINSSGITQWALPTVVTTSNAVQISAVSSTDGSTIIVWEDLRADQDIYTQIIDTDGTVVLAENGVPVSSAFDWQGDPVMVQDGSGGAIIAWRDWRNFNDSDIDIYAQRMNSSGSMLWTADGIIVSEGIYRQEEHNIINSSDGAIITWKNEPCFFCPSDIQAQKITMAGDTVWASNGIDISNATDYQMLPVALSDGSGGAIIAWSDYRNNPSDQDLYAARVYSSGALPVELSSFTATINGNSVILNWSTATEVNNFRFEIERSLSPNPSPGERSSEATLRGVWGGLGYVDGHGNSNSVKHYTFEDKDVARGNYQYRLKQIDNDGTFTYSNIVEASFMKPEEFSLSQNYPNPFNPVTNFGFRIADFGFVSLKVYDILGNEVAVLVNENKEPGVYTVSFDAANLAAGTYIYRLTAGEFQKTMKMVLLK